MRVHRRPGLTLIELMIVVAIIAAIAAVAIPGLRRARIAANEARAISTLLALSAAQGAFRQGQYVDQDGDGEGEYGFLQELAGLSGRRGRSAAGDDLIEAQLGRSAAALRGVAELGGYRFAIHLPSDRAAIGEHQGLAAPRPSFADNQERFYVIYAWPVQHGRTGKRAFAIGHESEVVATANREGRYSGASAPAPGAALDASDKAAVPAVLDARLGGAARATGDAQPWTGVR